MEYRGTLLIGLLGLVMLAACSGAPPPAVPRNAPDDLQATAAWESYRQSAIATQTVAAREAAAIAHSLMATDTAARATTSAQSTRASQEATATTQAGYVTATHEAGIATATARAVNATATHHAGATTATAVAAATRDSIQATSTAQSVQATATIQAIAAQREAMRLERERRLQPLKTYGPWFIGVALLVLLAALGSWVLIIAMKAWDARQRVIANGPFGRPLVLLDGPNGRRTILDPSRLFGPVVSVAGESVTIPQLAAPELQNQTTARSQAVELRQAAHPPYPIALPPPRPYRQPAPALSPSSAPQHAEPALPLPTDAPWSILHQEWQGNGLPLGMGVRGLLVADPEAYPHLLMAGTSGSGKTRFGLRPLITSALASGWQVAIYDRSGLDFLPFQQHPNARTVLLEDPSQAIAHLALLYETIQARFLVLREAGASTWGRLPGGGSSASPPGPRILAVMDEFANLADALPANERRELWRGARMIAAEGRKAGVHLALALQDPTHKSLDLRIRRNCLPLSFRVKDGDTSRVILGAGGAEQLPPRQFLTVMDRLLRGVAFAPSDEEIGAFLAARPVTPHPAPAWLEAEIAPATSAHEQRETEQRIRALLGQGWSLRAVQRELFGYTGGAAYEAVKAVQAQMTADTGAGTGGGTAP
jgi:hypothetical protein